MIPSNDLDKAGGPAFPTSAEVNFNARPQTTTDQSKPWFLYNGMTLRDWFAGQALSEAIQQADVLPTRDLAALFGRGEDDPPPVTRQEAVAALAYAYADAMLAQRSK
jgi:hypothetical protein